MDLIDIAHHPHHRAIGQGEEDVAGKAVRKRFGERLAVAAAAGAGRAHRRVDP